MRKGLLTVLCTLFYLTGVTAQETTRGAKSVSRSEVTSTLKEDKQRFAEIKFDNEKHNFGVFYEDSAKVSHIFTFTNIGTEPLVINQVSASCGCTTPEYTKTPIKSGEKGQVKVTYNGEGRLTGKFRKTITVRSNAKKEIVRLYIEGEMNSKK